MTAPQNKSSTSEHAAVTLQPPLPLPYRVSYETADFVVTPANREAYAHATDWAADWPKTPLAEGAAHAVVIAGPAGAGKTHVSHIFAARSGAQWLQAAALSAETIATLPITVPLIAENITSWDETVLFHLLNHAKLHHVPLWLTAETAPAHHPWRLADVRSRLLALPVVAITAPDDTLLTALLSKQFADRGLRITPEILHYLLPRIDRSFAAVANAVSAIDSLALARKKGISFALIREAMGDIS